MKTQIESDGRIVWINGSDGSCLGRFSRFGIDLHRSVADQVAGMPQCLDCTHEMPSMAEWRRFQEGALVHFGVVVPDSHCPTFLDGEV